MGFSFYMSDIQYINAQKNQDKNYRLAKPIHFINLKPNSP